ACSSRSPLHGRADEDRSVVDPSRTPWGNRHGALVTVVLVVLFPPRAGRRTWRRRTCGRWRRAIRCWRAAHIGKTAVSACLVAQRFGLGHYHEAGCGVEPAILGMVAEGARRNGQLRVRWGIASWSLTGGDIVGHHQVAGVRCGDAVLLGQGDHLIDQFLLL